MNNLFWCFVLTIKIRNDQNGLNFRGGNGQLSYILPICIHKRFVKSKDFINKSLLLWPNARKKSCSAHVELYVVQFSDCYVEPGQRYSMISETLPNWGGLKVENFGGKFKFQNLSSWNTLFSTLGGDEIIFSGFIWGQELITKCPCWVKLHITEDNFLPLFKPPQFRFFLSKNVKLFEAIRSPLIFLWKPFSFGATFFSSTRSGMTKASISVDRLG